MSLRNYPILVKLTLFFFLCMVCYSPVYAQQFDFAGKASIDPLQVSGNNIPVTYVTPAQAEEIFQRYRQKGFEVQESSLQRLAELVDKQQITATPENNENTNTKADDCNRTGETSNREKQDQAIQKQQAVTQDQERPSKQDTRLECNDKKQSADSRQAPDSPMPVELPAPSASPQQPLPPPAEPLPPQPVPEPTVHTNVGIYADVSYGSGRGSHGDAGKVFFIVAGIMVIAAFIVYAGKYIVDLASGKDVKVWWEFIFSNTYLNTGSGEHGRLNGLKMGTGFVSSDLIQIALIAEVGESNIDLMIDEDTTTVPLDFSATYWLLGASARLHLTDKLVNASYLYIDFMGGKTSHGSTDTIGMARVGASFGVNDYLRLGASIGSFYLGLDEDQGFVNNDDNYWTTLGFEIGAKF